MGKLICIICSLLLLSGFTAKSQRLTDYVDPYIGSGGHGHVFVGANVPFGAVQVGPSNFFKGWDWCSGYNYRDSVIIGFPQLHLSGTGIGDLGDILIMPYMGEIKLDKGIETKQFSGYSSHYSHKNEKVRPGYYAVKLDDYGVEVELTASERVGFHKYKFPQGENVRIIIDLKEGINDKSTDTYIELTDQYTIKGYRSSAGWAKKQQVFFAIKFSTPIKMFDVYDNAKQIDSKKGKGESIKGLITFSQALPSVGKEISFKVGISPVSSENAMANINAEIPHWDFEKVKQQALDKWEKELSKIQIETKNEADKRIFYTSMYHVMMHPSLFNDHNGDYMGADWKIHKKTPYDTYTIFSLWDTYRAAHPLFTITNPDKVSDFINSMLDIYDQTGALPIWHLRGYDTGTMVGISSFQIISEAYLKGIKGFDPERAYKALKGTAMSDIRGLDYVRDLKPIPSDSMKNRPVAMALELAIGDAGIALMAKKLGKIDDYNYFLKRAQSYKSYYDKESGFIRGKMANGAWNPVFDPIKSKRPYASDYAEGNAWQYLWLSPQDIYGLIDLLGGEEVFLDRLDTFFSLDFDPSDPDVLIDLTGNIGQYSHGNEPSHHIAYMYTYAGQQWKTARLTRHIMKEFYTDQPDGIIGNEDCGQMSGWYILSSLGFYPVFTASGEYVIGSPVFDKATINLGNGKHFTVEAINNSPENIYVQSVELNGKDYPYTYINHQDIINGGSMKFRMGNKPNYNYGKNPIYRPESGGNDSIATKPFCHPGMAQTQEDLDYMKQQVLAGKQPWKTAFENLKKATNLDFKPEAFTHISVGPYGANSIGGKEYGESAEAAYNHAIMWYITGNKAYANKSIEILNAWSYRLWDFDANNAKLNVGLSGPQFLNAAEILRYTDSGWSKKDIDQFEQLVMSVFYPTIKDFFTEANGNWDASIIHTIFCIGVFMDDHEIFNRGVDRFYHGVGNSSITKYIYPTGQCQETTRDWDHVQLGIGEFAKAAQVAWTQGLDLYSAADDRLALGFEYTSKFMLGGDIPVFGVLSQRRKDKFKDVYESIYNHYQTVKGIKMPHTEEVINKRTRPESSTGVLTALRTTPDYVPVAQKQALQPDSKAKLPSKTGALDTSTYSASNSATTRFPSGSIIIRPGESIQEAIDDNQNNGKQNSGKWIVLAKGVHTLKESLKMQNGITLAGEGKESILFLSPELTTSTIINASNDMHDVVIRDLLIEGAIKTVENEDPNHDRRGRSYMSAPSRGGILFSADEEDQMKNIRFENITVQNCTKNGVAVKGASRVKVLNCDFSDNGSSVVPGAGFHHNLLLLHVSDCEIRNSRFDTSPWGSGINLSFSRNVVITGNEAARNALFGIYSSKNENILITDNLVEGNDRNGIFQDASTGKKYDSYKGLVIAGYQGWFSAPGDGSDRDWYHYTGKDGFRPGSCKIDMWPDVSEYEKIYKTEFSFADGSPAYTFSSYDESTVKTHFRWMREYGVDGVFVQRFVSEIKIPKSYNQLNKVFKSAIQAANNNNRAISIMYDLSGMVPGDEKFVLDDIDSICSQYDIKQRNNNPSYLYHNGKPLVAVWGVGFDDKRKYGLKEAENIIDALMERGFSILIGVPTNWRLLEKDAINDTELHRIIRKCDIVMPWFVGRYSEDTFAPYEQLVKEDIDWCKQNKVDYAPLAFPGFTWINMHKDSKAIPRNKGSFYWKQLSSYIGNGAEMIYLAMFDEIDEGTAIFKCATEVPAGESYFLPIDKELGSDYYLWMAGEAARMLRKERPFTPTIPLRVK